VLNGRVQSGRAPISEDDFPALEYFMTNFSTSFSLYGAQEGTRERGFLLPLFPFEPEYIRAMVSSSLYYFFYITSREIALASLQYK